MLITVEYAAQAKEAAGISSEKVQVPPFCSLQDIAAIACRGRSPRLRETLMGEGGMLYKSTLVLVNDSQVFHDESPEIKEGDRVTFLPPVSGG